MKVAILMGLLLSVGCGSANMPTTVNDTDTGLVVILLDKNRDTIDSQQVEILGIEQNSFFREKNTIILRNMNKETRLSFKVSGYDLHETTISNLERYRAGDDSVYLRLQRSDYDSTTFGMIYGQKSSNIRTRIIEKTASVILEGELARNQDARALLNNALDGINQAIGRTVIILDDALSAVRFNVRIDYNNQFFADFPGAAGGARVITDSRGVIQSCEVIWRALEPYFTHLSNSQMHEMTHCLGFDHNPEAGLMNATALLYNFNDFTEREKWVMEFSYNARWPGNRRIDSDINASIGHMGASKLSVGGNSEYIYLNQAHGCQKYRVERAAGRVRYLTVE